MCLRCLPTFERDFLIFENLGTYMDHIILYSENLLIICRNMYCFKYFDIYAKNLQNFFFIKCFFKTQNSNSNQDIFLM